MLGETRKPSGFSPTWTSLARHGGVTRRGADAGSGKRAAFRSVSSQAIIENVAVQRTARPGLDRKLRARRGGTRRRDRGETGRDEAVRAGSWSWIFLDTRRRTGYHLVRSQVHSVSGFKAKRKSLGSRSTP